MQVGATRSWGCSSHGQATRLQGRAPFPAMLVSGDSPLGVVGVPLDPSVGLFGFSPCAPLGHRPKASTSGSSVLGSLPPHRAPEAFPSQAGCPILNAQEVAVEVSDSEGDSLLADACMGTSPFAPS